MAKDTFAIIETGGHQYQVAQGVKLQIEKIETEAGKKVTFAEVLLVADGDKAQVGQPFVAGASVEAKVVAHGRDPKITVMKKWAKKRREVKRGHRQPFTEIEITAVKTGGAAKKAEPKAKPATKKAAPKAAAKKPVAKK